MTTPKTIKPTKLKTDLKKQNNPNTEASSELEHDYAMDTTTMNKRERRDHSAPSMPIKQQAEKKPKSMDSSEACVQE